MNIVAQELKYFASKLDILLVDDDERLRIELKRMLQIFFKSVTVASDGSEAFEVYTTKSFDLVITDIDMPNMNGIELSQKIKSFNGNQAIIILSGFIESYLSELNDMKIDSLLLKPFTLNKFMEILRKESEILFLEK